MNFFEHHIGDYDQATAHLSACEDGIYSRLIRWYYASEEPLPGDIKAIQRRVRARTREEREAVETVLSEFFELVDGVYHQHRCDETIARYHETQPDREAKKENDRERQRRARERRKGLFEELRRHDIVPPFDAKTADLEAMLERAKSRGESRAVTPPVTRDNTANHYPLPTTQYPEERGSTPPPPPAPARAREAEDPRSPGEAQQPTPSASGAACLAMRRAGVQDVNPSHPRLQALVAAGVTAEELGNTAAEAKARGTPRFAWVLATVEGRRRDAAAGGTVPAAAAAAPASDPMPWRQTTAGVRAMAAQLRMSGPRDGEAWPAYESRVVAVWRRQGSPTPQPTTTEAA